MKNNIRCNIFRLMNRLLRIQLNIRKDYLFFLIIFNSFSQQVAILITTDGHFLLLPLCAISYKYLFPAVIKMCLFGYGSKMKITSVKCHLIIPFIHIVRKKKKSKHVKRYQTYEDSTIHCVACLLYISECHYS